MATIQIFGFKNCRETQKAERFFKERRVPYQLVNLAEKPLSPGELNSVKRATGLENLIDREGRQFAKRNLAFMEFDIEEELLEDPLLYKTPVVRKATLATVGFQPEIWKAWLAESN